MNLGGGGRVRRALVVNDDAVQSAMVATTLEKTGLAVTRVRHGEEAIEVATQGTPYAIIVTDLYMPVIDGWRLCRLLRSPSYPDYASVPIIVMSATFTAGEGERIAGEIGANAFLPFPYSADDLRGMVARLLTGDVAPTRRALVIMDESKVREPMGQGLAKSGYFVRSAPTAKAGMALFEQGAWDLVVLGYNLPDGNAVRLLPSFRKPGRACTVIVVTTDPHTVLVSRTGEGFVSDPIDVERFLSLCGVGGDDDELAGLRDAVERAARELDVERTRVGELLDIADPPIVRIDARGVITLAGASAARALGAAPGELIGRRFAGLVDAADIAAVSDALAEAAGGVPSGLRARLIPHNGGGARVAIAACASAGVTPDDAGVWIAIGSPAKADPRTRSLQIIVDNMSHGAAIANGEGRFVYVNRAWAAMHGVSPEKMAGMPMRDFHDDDAYQADVVPLSLAAAEHPVAFAELTHRRADGGSFRTTVRALPVAVEGHANAFLILTRGADELRSMNAGETAVDADLAADLDRAREEIEDLRSQLLQAQRLEVINNLAAGLAHNFNNLLTAIVGNQELAYPYVSEEGRVFLANARQATRRAADLSRKLLSFSKKGKIERMSMDPVPVIMETTKMLRGAIDPRIVVQCVAPLDIWQVFADPGDIHQIAMNLCVNARDAIQDVLDREGPRDGPFQIVVKLENVEIDGNYTRVDPQATPGSYVTLSISDNGCGMDDETRRRVFEPFFTTKHARSGTGLGLATVFDMVKRMHGWISLDSEAGRGTTFRVYLPRHSGDLTLAADSEHFQELRGGHETILLVDDELVLRKLGEATLTRMGYRVVLAPDGMEGVKLFERMREDIDLVILDLTMPIMSGQEALELIKGLAPEKPVILSSGYADREAHDAQPDLGWSAFLPKPFDPNDLVRVVRQVLDNPLPH